MKLKSISTVAVLAGLGICFAGASANADQFPNYHLLKTVSVPSSASGWDYPTFDPATKQLFVGHRLDGVEVFDTLHNFRMKKVPDTKATNDIALIPEFGLGVAAANTGTLTVFKLSDLSEVKKIKVGDDLDSSAYDPATHRLVPVNANTTADGKGQTLNVLGVPDFGQVGSVVVPSTDLEHSVADGQGNIYFAAQDTNSIIKLDMKTLTITANYPTSGAGCTEPTGLALDPATQRLFIGCRGNLTSPMFAVMKADTGEIVFTAPISPGNDGLVFDSKNNDIFLTDGLGANMFIFHEDDSDKYSLAEIVDTSAKERTVALDMDGNHIYTIAAEGLVNPAKKILTHVSPFYPNSFTPNSFKIRVYGQ